MQSHAATHEFTCHRDLKAFSGLEPPPRGPWPVRTMMLAARVAPFGLCDHRLRAIERGRGSHRDRDVPRANPVRAGRRAARSDPRRRGGQAIVRRPTPDDTHACLVQSLNEPALTIRGLRAVLDEPHMLPVERPRRVARILRAFLG